MEITKAQEIVDQWINTLGVRYFNELTNTAILMEEVGEVARLMARMYGEQSFKNTEIEKNSKEALADELADVFFVLICIANQTGINLETALEKNLKKKSDRDNKRHFDNIKLALISLVQKILTRAYSFDLTKYLQTVQLLRVNLFQMVQILYFFQLFSFFRWFWQG